MNKALKYASNYKLIKFLIRLPMSNSNNSNSNEFRSTKIKNILKLNNTISDNTKTPNFSSCKFLIFQSLFIDSYSAKNTLSQLKCC